MPEIWTMLVRARNKYFVQSIDRFAQREGVVGVLLKGRLYCGLVLFAGQLAALMSVSLASIHKCR